MTSWLIVATALALVAGSERGENGMQDMQQMQELSQPGAEHEALATLAGEWTVEASPLMAVAGGAGEARGSAVARMRVDGRFLEIEMAIEGGLIGKTMFVIGYDRRHDHYTVSYMDDTGTYGVHAVGVREGDAVVMYGADDPVMTSMGFTKEFVIALHFAAEPDSAPSEAAIEIRFIDTRTDARPEMPFYRFDLTR